MKHSLSKKIALLLFCLLLGIGLLAGCSDKQNAVADKPAIVIVHTNDVHGGFTATDALTGGSSAWTIGHDVVASIYESYAADSTAFLLDAGDAWQGVYFVGQNKGLAAVEIMNAVGYDAMTLGNHEFDYGWEHLSSLIEAAAFPILSQIEDAAALELENLYNYTVIEREGVTIGVFGITTPETQFKSAGGFGREFGSVQDIIGYAALMAQTLRETEDVDYVICLSHLGVEDMGYGTSYNIRDAVEGIDLIIDGHSHTTLDDIENVAGKTQITSAGSGGEYVGVAKLQYLDGELQVELLNISKEDAVDIEPKAEISTLIASWINVVATEGAAVVAQIPFDISVNQEFERTGETVMGNIVTDAMLLASGADIALENGGGLRNQQLTAGAVSKAQLISILPFGNTLQMAEVSGAVILEALELGVSRYPEQNGGFLHASGLTYSFDPAAESGSRIVEVLVAGQPLDAEATYLVCTNDFIALGGDQYSMFAEPFSQLLPLDMPELTTLDEVLIWYLQEYHASISNELQGRVTVLQSAE